MLVLKGLFGGSSKKTLKGFGGQNSHQRTMLYWNYYGVVIYYRRSSSLFMEISCDISPGKQGVSETLP